MGLVYLRTFIRIKINEFHVGKYTSPMDCLRMIIGGSTSLVSGACHVLAVKELRGVDSGSLKNNYTIIQLGLPL